MKDSHEKVFEEWKKDAWTWCVVLMEDG